MRNLRGWCLFAFTTMNFATALPPAIGTELTVKVIAPQPPAEVTIQRDDDTQPRTLSHDKATGSYSLTIPKSITAAPEGAIRTSFTLVARWPDTSEQVYLALGTLLTEIIRVEIYRELVSGKRTELDALEALGSDFKSVLRRYFGARGFHRIWRYVNGQPQHQVSIRSARLWFDAAYSLAVWPNSIFNMDQEIVKIMNDYEELAKRDNDFNRRFRLSTNAGYIEGMVVQTIALEFRAAKHIYPLIARGNLTEAAGLNGKLLLRYEELTPETRAVVTRLQGINGNLLRANAQYIDTLNARASK